MEEEMEADLTRVSSSGTDPWVEISYPVEVDVSLERAISYKRRRKSAGRKRWYSFSEVLERRARAEGISVTVNTLNPYLEFEIIMKPHQQLGEMIASVRDRLGEHVTEILERQGDAVKKMNLLRSFAGISKPPLDANDIVASGHTRHQLVFSIPVATVEQHSAPVNLVKQSLYAALCDWDHEALTALGILPEPLTSSDEVAEQGCATKPVNVNSQVCVSGVFKHSYGLRRGKQTETPWVTPLHLAVWQENLTGVRDLLNAGADVRIYDGWGTTVESLAVDLANPSIFSLFGRTIRGDSDSKAIAAMIEKEVEIIQREQAEAVLEYNAAMSEVISCTCELKAGEGALYLALRLGLIGSELSFGGLRLDLKESLEKAELEDGAWMSLLIQEEKIAFAEALLSWDVSPKEPRDAHAVGEAILNFLRDPRAVSSNDHVFRASALEALTRQLSYGALYPNPVSLALLYQDESREREAKTDMSPGIGTMDVLDECGVMISELAVWTTDILRQHYRCLEEGDEWISILACQAITALCTNNIRCDQHAACSRVSCRPGMCALDDLGQAGACELLILLLAPGRSDTLYEAAADAIAALSHGACVTYSTIRKKAMRPHAANVVAFKQGWHRQDTQRGCVWRLQELAAAGLPGVDNSASAAAASRALEILRLEEAREGCVLS